jgi:hypothetical protein
MKASILAVLALVLSQSAFAQHYHGHGGYYGPRVGVYFGTPYMAPPYPWYAPPAYYYPPVYAPVVTVREAPSVYIEQDQVVVPAAPVQQSFESGYWYYCRESRAYYPTVSSCPSSWQKVAPSTNQNR